MCVGGSEQGAKVNLNDFLKLASKWESPQDIGGLKLPPGWTLRRRRWAWRSHWVPLRPGGEWTDGGVTVGVGAPRRLPVRHLISSPRHVMT